MTAVPTIKAFFDEPTNTISYLVADPATKRAAIVDPVLDYDHASGKASTESADVILDEAEALGLTIDWVLETHAHADHLSGAPYIKLKTGAKVGIGEHIREVQKIFRPVFNATDVIGDGSEFDHLFKDGERFELGNIEAAVLHVPGHTPADIAYRIGDPVFVGDTLFMPDFGSARADFPGGDARTLCRSIRRLLALPPETRLFMCTTTRHRAATAMPGRRRSARSALTMSMSKTVSARRSSSQCAKRVTRRSPRPSCSCHRSR